MSCSKPIVLPPFHMDIPISSDNLVPMTPGLCLIEIPHSKTADTSSGSNGRLQQFCYQTCDSLDNSILLEPHPHTTRFISAASMAMGGIQWNANQSKRPRHSAKPRALSMAASNPGDRKPHPGRNTASAPVPSTEAFGLKPQDPHPETS